MSSGLYEVKSKTRSGFRSMIHRFQRLTANQRLVVNATDPKIKWGPETADMDQIAEYTFDSLARREIFDVIWNQLDPEGKKDWRAIYKTLLLLEHLLYHGSDRAVEAIQRNVHKIRTLSSFMFKDEHGTDQGVNVRKRSAIVADLAEDEDLADERKRHQENKARFRGLSSGVGASASPAPSRSSTGAGGAEYTRSPRAAHAPEPSQPDDDPFGDPVVLDPQPADPWAQPAPAPAPAYSSPRQWAGRRSGRHDDDGRA